MAALGLQVFLIQVLLIALARKASIATRNGDHVSAMQNRGP